MWQQMEELSIEEELDRHFAKKASLPLAIDDESFKARITTEQAHLDQGWAKPGFFGANI